MFNKKFEFETHHHDHSVNFPKNINVHEHKAPTDDSVRLLKEMEEKALDDVVLKISEVRQNRFSFNIWFVRFADLDMFPKGMMYIRFNCNGKDYVRKVKCTGSMMQLALSNGPQGTLSEMSQKMQHFVLFQTSLIVAQLLFDVNPEAMSDIFHSAAMGDPMKFDLDTISDELEFWETPPEKQM